MDVFLAGTGVALDVPLTDNSGNAIAVTAVQYRVIDENGNELAPRQDLIGFVPEGAVATVPVTALMNTLATGVMRSLRQVELFCTVDGNTTLLTAAFVVAQSEVLEVGVNSFQTYAQAQFTALSLPNIPAWDTASADERLAALIEARTHIVQLSFTQLNSNVNWGQDSLNYIPEGTYLTEFVGDSNMFMFNGNLELLRPDQFAKLPTKFIDVLKKAQVAEANSILGGDSVDQKRRDGLVLDTIGESKQMFRSSKPLELPVCRRALGYLSYFISFAKRIGRM